MAISGQMAPGRVESVFSSFSSDAPAKRRAKAGRVPSSAPARSSVASAASSPRTSTRVGTRTRLARAPVGGGHEERERCRAHAGAVFRDHRCNRRGELGRRPATVVEVEHDHAGVEGSSVELLTQPARRQSPQRPSGTAPSFTGAEQSLQGTKILSSLSPSRTEASLASRSVIRAWRPPRRRSSTIDSCAVKKLVAFLAGLRCLGDDASWRAARSSAVARVS